MLENQEEHTVIVTPTQLRRLEDEAARATAQHAAALAEHQAALDYYNELWRDEQDYRRTAYKLYGNSESCPYLSMADVCRDLREDSANRRYILTGWWEDQAKEAMVLAKEALRQTLKAARKRRLPRD